MKNTRLLIMLLSLAGLPLLFLLSCNQPGSTAETKDDYYQLRDTGVQTGGVQVIPVQTAKGKFNVWTKRTGNNPKIKVLLLTGGPGLSHEYVECFESFFPKEAIEFIYYDQLGCGASEHPTDTALYNVPEAVKELEQVRIALHLDKSNLYLWGHSWGGILAMEYAVKHPQNLKGLIVSNMVSSATVFNKYVQNVLVKQMNPTVADSLMQMESNGDTDNPKYLNLITQHFYTKHICRLPEWPEPLTRSLSKINTAFYNRMQGKSEFRLNGKLANWSISSRLPKITVPTLVIGAKYDEMDPQHMKWMASQIPHATFLYCPKGSHMAMYDDQQVYMKGLIHFIKDNAREQ